MDLVDRARAYVAKMPAAVSGQDGHGSTFAVARVLVHFFQLGDQEATTVLAEYNKRCQPPWSSKELEHKLKSAKQSTWTGPRAATNGESAGDKESKSRTLRTAFPRFKPAEEGKTTPSRTLRTEIFHNHMLCARTCTPDTKTHSAENPSEVSGPSPAPEPQNEAGGKAYVARLERGEVASPSGGAWIAADGKVYRSRREPLGQGERIVIGKKVADPPPEVRG